MSESGIYKFTSQIQQKILTLLWRDKNSYSVYREVIKPKYFTQSIHIDLCRIILDYYEQYGNSPTVDVLVEEITQICEKSKTKQKLEDDYLKCIADMAEIDLFDVDYVKDKILAFGKRQALVDAVLESAEILEKEQDTQYSKIEKLIKNALLVGEDINDLGIDIYKDIDERFLSYLNDDDVIERIPTEMVELDAYLGGGLGRTEMGVVVAPPGKGKTTFLISLGGAALENGYKVLHISFENNAKQIIRNYDLRLLKKNMDYVRENIEKTIAAMKLIKKYRKGGLKVKKWATKTKDVNSIRSLLDQLRVVESFVPDVLIVDYGAIMKPVNSNQEKRNAIESNYEDLRAVADDYNLALWTAAQGNRAALSKKIVTMGDLAECFAIGNTTDIMVCMCQTPKEKQKGDMRLYLSKVRDSADSAILTGKIFYDQKRLEFYGLADEQEGDEEPDLDEKGWESDDE